MRKLLTLLLPVSLLLSVHVLAVSLGDELILSRLGDPVEIEIEVLQWEDIDLERVEISAATREEYDVFNLTWLPVLEELSFNMVGPDLDGDVRVLISSRDPLNEPFLELLLVLRWPGGSLRREYVLLFDPPRAPTPALTAVVATPVAESVERPASQRPPVEDSIAVADVTAPAVQAEETVELAGAAALPVAALSEEELPPVVVQSPVEEELPRVVEVPVEEAPPPAVEVTVEQELPPVLELPVEEKLPPAIELAVEEELPVVAETPSEEFPPLVDEEPSMAEMAPVLASDSEPVMFDPAPQPDPEPPPLVTTVVEEILEREVALPPPEPELPAPEAEEIEAPDARTQTAIEVETLIPQPAPVVPDTTRRAYQVRSGDSLWNIARQFRPAGAGENLFQMLLSMHNLNRSSFINGNISLLKANATLQVPTADDISAIDPLTAEAEFDRRWNEGTQRFDATQRGEPIPLFAGSPPPEDLVEEVEDELPIGAEASGADTDASALIVVSQTNVPQPLRIEPDAETETVPANESSETTELESEAVLIVQTRMVAGSETQQPLPATPAAPTSVTVERMVTRAVLAAELEAEVAAMRTRRQSAEAVAQQLNASLQRAQAQRAAQASFFGTENLLLAGSSLLLFAALLAAVVFSLRVAGDLRLRASDTTLDHHQPEPTWTKVSERAAVPERKEPHMPEMEVVELQMPTSAVTELTQAAATGVADNPPAEDLFARMDDILGTDTRNSSKSG